MERKKLSVGGAYISEYKLLGSEMEEIYVPSQSLSFVKTVPGSPWGTLYEFKVWSPEGEYVSTVYLTDQQLRLLKIRK